MNHLAAIGFGYTAKALAARLDTTAWRVTGSSRTEAGATAISNMGWTGFVLDADTPTETLAAALSGVTHLLLSAGPAVTGDPVIDRLDEARTNFPNLKWIGYLSTVGVYGNHDGGWVDQATPPKPSSVRGQRRLLAENAWLAFGTKHGITVQVFRLPGIYGPGRSAFERISNGKARRINKPGQVFNRIHVDDIAGALEAAMHTTSGAGPIFDLVDDLPTPPQDVIAYAAQLMGIEPPPEVAFADADITDMARSFYSENKRVSNQRMRDELGYRPIYSTYREGLAAIWEGMSR